MPKRYQDVYPEDALLNSATRNRHSALNLLTLEFFEAEPGEMPYEVFTQHHILISLREKPHRVENWRDGEHRDFIIHNNEIVVTPAGVKSGWKWHEKSKCIVITLEPDKLENFAQSELGVLLSERQLKDIPQFIDEDITQAAVMLRDALSSNLGSDVMFESFSRVFLVKLIQKYGSSREDDIVFTKSFTSKHYKRVLDYVTEHFGQHFTLETLAKEAGLSTYHFSRLFKATIGVSPHQFVMQFRIEQSKKNATRPKSANDRYCSVMWILRSSPFLQSLQTSRVRHA